jgi:hypothetical protein
MAKTTKTAGKPRQTGLAAYAKAQQRRETNERPTTTRAAPTSPTTRRRGTGETVALTVRIPRDDWQRLHQLATAQGVSLQHLMLRGLSSVFTDEGLPGIDAITS